MMRWLPLSSLTRIRCVAESRDRTLRDFSQLSSRILVDLGLSCELGSLQVLEHGLLGVGQLIDR